jgi:putative flippase GtrA
MEKIKTLLNDRDRRREIILYLVFGVLTTVVNLLVYGGLILAVEPKRVLFEYILWFQTPLYWYSVASVIAWVAAVTFAYVGNKLYVFRSRNLSRRELVQEVLSFFGARVLSLLLFDLAGLSLLIQAFNMDEFLAKLIMNILVIIFNYFASKLVIFKKKA